MKTSLFIALLILNALSGFGQNVITFGQLSIRKVNPEYKVEDGDTLVLERVSVPCPAALQYENSYCLVSHFSYKWVPLHPEGYVPIEVIKKREYDVMLKRTLEELEKKTKY